MSKDDQKQAIIIVVAIVVIVYLYTSLTQDASNNQPVISDWVNVAIGLAIFVSIVYYAMYKKLPFL